MSIETNEIASKCEVSLANEISGSTVLITGGAGFLGSWLCDVMLLLGAHVICLDDFSSGRYENIEHLIPSHNFHLIRHDITNPILFDDDITHIFHLASNAAPFEFTHYPVKILKANTLGVLNTLDIARAKEARYTFTSTSEIYGDPDSDHIPTPEDYTGNVSPIRIRSCYDEAKRCGEALIMAYRSEHGINTRIARLFNTFGPRERWDGIYGRAMPRFLHQALNNKPITIFGEGVQTRSWCYITDTITALLRLGYLPGLSGSVVNIGNPHEITILKLVQQIIKATHSKSKMLYKQLPQDDPLRRCPDISKAKKLLDWKPSISLNDGITRTLASEGLK